MGGGISTMFAGVYPELVDKLVLIEGFGPMSKDPSTTAASMRKALDEESKFHLKDISINGGRLYSSVHEAVGEHSTIYTHNEVFIFTAHSAYLVHFDK
jgi:pimeloyl-ACP methyl ester carboxylesterase